MMRSQLLPEGGGAPVPARPCCALYRWLVVGLIFLVVLILFVQRINVSVAIIPWATECGWNEAQQQSLLGAFFWGYLVTMFPGALLSNRFTAHHEGLAVVLVLSCALCAATPLAGCNAELAAAARIGVGMAQGPLFPLVSGLFGQWVRPNEYSRANAFVCEGSNLGVLVAFPYAHQTTARSPTGSSRTAGQLSDAAGCAQGDFFDLPLRRLALGVLHPCRRRRAVPAAAARLWLLHPGVEPLGQRRGEGRAAGRAPLGSRGGRRGVGAVGPHADPSNSLGDDLELVWTELVQLGAAHGTK